MENFNSHLLSLDQTCSISVCPVCDARPTSPEHTLYPPPAWVRR